MTDGWTCIGKSRWFDFGECGRGCQEYWQRRIGTVTYEVSTGVFGSQVGYRHHFGYFCAIPHPFNCSVESGMLICENWASRVARLPLSARDAILWCGGDPRRRFEDAFRFGSGT